MKQLLTLGLISLSLYASAQKPGYHILKTFHIQSEGGWDYLAVGPNNQLYVSHATQVNILDKTTGDSLGVIKNTTGVHGIAFVPQLNKGFISDGKLNKVTVFDLNTNQPTGEIKTGDNPDAIMYDPFSKMIVVCDGHSHSATIISPADNSVAQTIPLDGKPETAVTDKKGKIYINIEDKSEIEVLNAKNWQVIAHWPLVKAKTPSGLAIDDKSMRLFAGCDNQLLAVIDANNGKNIDNLPIGDGCDGVAFDPALKQVYSSNGDGTLTVIKEMNANKYNVAQNVATEKGARTIAVDYKTHLIYLPTASFKPLEAGAKRPKMVPGTFRVLVVGK